MQCVILAGGLGTRLRPFTDLQPKSLVPVLGRPFVAWQLDLLRARGVEEVLFCLGYGGAAIRDLVGDGSGFDLSVTYAEEGDDLAGTGGALARAARQHPLRDDFVVTYGDSYLTTDYRALVGHGRREGAPAVMTLVAARDGLDAGNARFDGRHVTEYRKGGPRPLPFIDYGLTFLRRDAVAEIDPAHPTDLGELFSRLAREGRLLGYEVGERFHEVGSWEGVAELERYLARRGRSDEEAG